MIWVGSTRQRRFHDFSYIAVLYATTYVRRLSVEPVILSLIILAS